MNGTNVLTATAIVGTGLMAGLFFGWMVSVIPGTRLLDDRTYIATMQQINRSIVNPGFAIPFFGTPVLLVAAARAQRRVGNDRAAMLLGVATGLYVVGLLGVTAVGNIPLNNALDAFDLRDADAEALREQRSSYERPWNRWHGVRSAAVGLAFGCAALSAAIDSE
ncbi:MAG: anthrone oxygenase family protein [Ilumatobacter sp.]|uniref:anthrone oxygenase family protein n=1 Tax=Ilumatobacter sp. TaxID=1967498 RepID=UPI003C712C6C